MYVGELINTVQSEVSVGSKYWILSGLAVVQFSSENFNSIMRLNYVYIIATTNKLVVYGKGKKTNRNVVHWRLQERKLANADVASSCVPLFLFMRGKWFLTAVVFAIVLGLTTTAATWRTTRGVARRVTGNTGVFLHVYSVG